MLFSYWKLIVAGLIAVVIGVHLFMDGRVKNELEETKVALAAMTTEKIRVEQELLRATEDAKVLDSSLKAAEVSREALVKSYDARLRALKVQTPKIPTECPKVIEWAIEHSLELDWPASP
jgi:Na+-translocating ferredoxin:NAD+ oxidoreductase RnfD subunit